MVVCFAADFKHIDRKDECRFFRFPSNTKEYKKWEDYLSNFNSPQKEMTYAIAIVNKKSREPHCVIWKWASAT